MKEIITPIASRRNEYYAYFVTDDEHMTGPYPSLNAAMKAASENDEIHDYCPITFLTKVKAYIKNG